MLTVDAAARELGVSVVTLRRWLARGAPHRPGRRGRGHAALVDVGAVRAWRQANDRDTALLELAQAVPGVLARATAEAFRQIEGPDKRRMAGVLAGLWYVLTTAMLDRLSPAVPELAHEPPEIERLREIARS